MFAAGAAVQSLPPPPLPQDDWLRDYQQQTLPGADPEQDQLCHELHRAHQTCEHQGTMASFSFVNELPGCPYNFKSTNQLTFSCRLQSRIQAAATAESAVPYTHPPRQNGVTEMNVLSKCP